MTPLRIEGLLQRIIRRSVEGRDFFAVCMSLATAGTLSAGFPVTAVVVPAALLQPLRWRAIAVVCALGSGLGATLLVVALHHLGWSQLYIRFPQLATNHEWMDIIEWVSRYGILALFLIALSPLPQTPALIFFAMARHDYPSVFAAITVGKMIKYSLFAWAAARFPERFLHGVTGLFHRSATPDGGGDAGDV